MDVRLQGNSHIHYGINGAPRNSRTGEDESLQFLSREEQECIQFLEETIESLEESLEEDDQRPTRAMAPDNISQPIEQVDGLHPINPNPGASMSSHEIIDLVHSEPDLVPSPVTFFSHTDPDFQHMIQTPESHFEIKPSHDNLHPEYNPPLRSGSFGPSDNHPSYHPLGYIPTPVLIAQKLAETQNEDVSSFHPSSLLRRLSSDSGDKPNTSAKHSPSASAKQSHYPSNIHVNFSGKEQQKPVANVSIHERQEQMFANLSGTSHPLMEGLPQQVMEEATRNTPSRSISFRDPTPAKSREEALTKLGLSRNRAVSVNLTTDNSSEDPIKGPDSKVKSPEPRRLPTAQSQINPPETNLPIPPPNSFKDDRKPEILPTHVSSSYHEERFHQQKPLSTTGSPYRQYAPERTYQEITRHAEKSSVSPQPVLTRTEPANSPSNPEPKALPPELAQPTELNPYGGKSKVMTPASVPRTNLPDILSSHIEIPAKPEPQHVDANSYGGKSVNIHPITGLRTTGRSPAKSLKGPPPPPAPRPSRNSYHGFLSPHKPPSQTVSPDYRRRPASMFRPQGITVQFCGRGAMNDSRRDALRRLGLLKDS